MRATAPTVFRCGASRNKREGVLSPEPIGDLEPGIYVIFYSDFAGRSLRGRNKLRRVAIRRLGWRRTARPCESQEQRLFCQVQPCRPSGSKPAGPTATSVAGLRWGRLRPARLYESQKHSPTHGPKHCPVSASLRLRCRSAAFSRALRDSSTFGYRRNSRIAPLGVARVLV